MLKRKKNGFTLLEMSLVLVVIGLVIGGVLTGSALLHTAEISSTVKDIGKYTTAIKTFESEYKSLPGDMPNATGFWGIAGGSGSDPTCAATVTTGKTATCNGNGDGLIMGSGYNGNASRYEIYRAWQHLTNAKLIEGSFTGVVGAKNPQRASDSGINAPAGKIQGSGFDFFASYSFGNNSDTNFFPGIYGNFLVFGSSGDGNDIAITPILEPVDAENIDRKIDDGKPATGLIVVAKNTSIWIRNCSTSNDPTTALYNSSVTSIECSLFIILQSQL